MEAAQSHKWKHMLENSEQYDFSIEPKDPDDWIDEYIQILTEQFEFRQALAKLENEDTKFIEQKISSLYQMNTLEELICESITAIQSPETRNKMASKILLTGGMIWGKEYADFVDIVEDRLIHTITQIDKSIEKVDVIQVKDVDGRFLVWIGGAVCPRLESGKDMFIQREQWVWDCRKEKTDNEPKYEEGKIDAKVFSNKRVD